MLMYASCMAKFLRSWDNLIALQKTDEGQARDLDPAADAGDVKAELRGALARHEPQPLRITAEILGRNSRRDRRGIHLFQIIQI